MTRWFTELSGGEDDDFLATTTCRVAYAPYQRVFNVGFRVVLAPAE